MTKKKKIVDGMKRITKNHKYYTAVYKNGKRIGVSRWHGNNSESAQKVYVKQDIKVNKYFPSVPVLQEVREKEGINIRYNELTYYVTEHIRTTVKVGKGKKTRHSNVYCEVRLLDVVLPSNITPDRLVDIIRPYLQELAQSSIGRIEIGSSGGYPSNSLPTKTVTALMIKKNSGSNYEWYKETERVNIL